MYLNTVILYLLVLVSANASGQNEVAQGTQPEDLATVSIIPAKRSFAVGEPIEVTLLLEAGGRGVYVAKGWGEAGGGIPGFFVNIETLAGRGAQTCGFAADGLPTADQDAATLLREHFVFVAPSQIVGWKTNVLCPVERRGRYRIVANYSPGLPGTEEVAKLPEAKGSC